MFENNVKIPRISITMRYAVKEWAEHCSINATLKQINENMKMSASKGPLFIKHSSLVCSVPKGLLCLCQKQIENQISSQAFPIISILNTRKQNTKYNVGF